MESSTVGLIATTFVTLLSGISVFFSPFAGGISALMHYLPSAALSVASGISAANFVLANGCCICRYPSFLVPWHYLDEPMCQPSKRRSLNGRLIDKQKSGAIQLPSGTVTSAPCEVPQLQVRVASQWKKKAAKAAGTAKNSNTKPPFKLNVPSIIKNITITA